MACHQRPKLMCRLGQIHVYYSNSAHRAGYYVLGADEAVSGISVSFLRLGTEWNTFGIL
jgi:hypothetical protein